MKNQEILETKVLEKKAAAGLEQYDLILAITNEAIHPARLLASTNNTLVVNLIDEISSPLDNGNMKIDFLNNLNESYKNKNVLIVNTTENNPLLIFIDLMLIDVKVKILHLDNKSYHERRNFINRLSSMIF